MLFLCIFFLYFIMQKSCRKSGEWNTDNFISLWWGMLTLSDPRCLIFCLWSGIFITCNYHLLWAHLSRKLFWGQDFFRTPPAFLLISTSIYEKTDLKIVSLLFSYYIKSTRLYFLQFWLPPHFLKIWVEENSPSHPPP